MPQFLAQLSPDITVGTVCGRYYSMDRDNRWERVATAYDVMVLAKGVAPPVTNPLDALKQGYEDDLTDEFINPTVVGGGLLPIAYCLVACCCCMLSFLCLVSFHS